MIDSVAEFKEVQLQNVLREPEAFEILTDQNADGLYLIHFKRKDDPVFSVDFGTALTIADDIRTGHPAVADHIDECVEKGMRYVADS